MIKSFRHKGLRQLFETGHSALVRQDLQARTLRRLDALAVAQRPEDLNVTGFNFHSLQGKPKPKRYSVHVNGPWCVTFEWINGHAWHADLENYH